MKAEKRLTNQRRRRLQRVRNQVRRSAGDRPRLSVFRSNRHMYAQIIDDRDGKTLVSASTLESDLFGPGTYAGNRDAAARVGVLLAERAQQQGIDRVVFDRGEYRYHGRVASLADAARKGGLTF